MDYSIITLCVMFLMSEYYRLGSITVEDYYNFLEEMRKGLIEQNNSFLSALNCKPDGYKNEEN